MLNTFTKTNLSLSRPSVLETLLFRPIVYSYTCHAEHQGQATGVETGVSVSRANYLIADGTRCDFEAGNVC